MAIGAVGDLDPDGGEHPWYGAVIDRLRGAGREDEVLGWIDRAVEHGRVSRRLSMQGRDY